LCTWQDRLVRLQLLSDLHFEFHADGGRAFVDALDASNVDVLVLAGDIAVGSGIPDAIGMLCAHYARSTVVYVHGNHEYYGCERSTVVAITEELVRKHRNLAWLDAATLTIQGHRFLGGPLWFSRSEIGQRHRRAIADFSEVPAFESWVYIQNARMLDLLDAELDPGDIVVTHHLPSHRCVAPRFSGSALNAFFVCDVEELIEHRRPLLWLHGHTHSSVDLRIGETRVLCNPFGYAGWQINGDFRAQCIVEL
jgi:Icc-related predicted phosphoesterase